LRLHLKDGSQDTLLVRTESNDPKHQASLRSAMNLPKQFELDGAVRYVDNLKNLKVGSYVVGDVRVSWRGIPRTMMEVGAQNILKSRHREFRPGSAPGNEIKPNYYGRMTWDF
jgi:iron complex outermembrane receptor protein